MNDPRLVFFGTPEFAVPSLHHLLARGWPVLAVITQPDRPRGRGQKPGPAPVKAFAESRGLPVLQPERLKGPEFIGQLEALSPDLGVVAAYGRILPDVVIALPRLGLINVHASLLPRWRGASPVHRSVMAGDAETGVSIMRIVQALDAGGVFATARREIGLDETSEQVERDLAELGARLLVQVVEDLQAGRAREVPQDERGVTYAPRLTRDDGLITWDAPAAAIHNQVRGLHPWPHAFTSLRGSRVIVRRTALDTAAGAIPPAASPGELLEVARDGLIVAAGDGRAIRLLQLQAEGRRPVSAKEFAAGARLTAGVRFGS
jgi:methionyl-tRNA formyltransferase